MGKTADPEEMLALRELTILNTHELAALIAVLERKDLLTHREVLDEIQRQRQEKTQSGADGIAGRVAVLARECLLRHIPEAWILGEGNSAVQEFISEDDLKTFEGWLRQQAVDAATMSPEELLDWRCAFEEARKRSETGPKGGLMTLQPMPGEHRYAVAVREGSDLWLALWARRSGKGEFFVMLPRGDSDWDPHPRYHLDGSLHMKSHDRKVLSQKRQPLTGAFRGSEHLGVYSGHAPNSVGAICDPTAFAGIVEILPGPLGPRHGAGTVDRVEPGYEPMGFPGGRIGTRQVLRDIVPWVVITVGSSY